ncbi:MAG: zf-HC2 domain-containing protein [Actinobacteria bacterium]|nr:zf-HC2 domain-containing protein [Actinomycetota bacterium]
MRTESCREWRTSLGAYALGQLPAEERAGLEAHLEGCAECRAEAESLRSLGKLMARADPARIVEPAPRPPAHLRERVETTIGAERASERRSRRRRRFGFALGGFATAAAAAVLALVVFGGGGATPPEQQVAFTNLPKGVEIDATLQPHAFGTEIRMYVGGIRSGTLCRVFLRGDDGRLYPAGSFRYRWGNDAEAILSSALDLSRTRAIGVHAGNRTFVAPVGPGGATASVPQLNEEEPT